MPKKRPDEYYIEGVKKALLNDDRIFTGNTRRVRKFEVEIKCPQCKSVKFHVADNFIRGLSTQCCCMRGRIYPHDAPTEMLGMRYAAMVQRCTKGTHPSSHRYKDRGIKVLFTSRRHFIEWALENFDWKEFEGKEFDRIDNNGHYSPDNLRLVTHTENMNNREVSYRNDDSDPDDVSLY